MDLGFVENISKRTYLPRRTVCPCLYSEDVHMGSSEYLKRVGGIGLQPLIYIVRPLYLFVA